MKYIKLFEQFKTDTSLDDQLKSIRVFLETKWDNGSSNRQCIRTVYFLKAILGGAIKGGWVSSNPRPDQKGGFLDKNGQWNFHYWLQKDDKIIDITSDQFGEPAINILSLNDKRYHNTTDAQYIKQDFKHTPYVVDEWIKEYRQKRVDLYERQITAFHGTGKKFDEFSLDYTESGSGGSSYGWGLYFTTDENIAKNYSSRVIYNIKREIHSTYATKACKRLKREGIELHGFESIFHHLYKSYQSSIDDLKKEIYTFYRIKESDDLVILLLPFFKKIDKEEADAFIYHVTLHQGKQPNEYDYLSWDQPLTDKQYTKITKQFKKEKLPYGFPKTFKGEDVYEFLIRHMSKKDLSMLLLRAGIDGMIIEEENIVLVYDTNNITIDEIKKA
jgi:hypothetical protein